MKKKKEKKITNYNISKVNKLYESDILRNIFQLIFQSAE